MAKLSLREHDDGGAERHRVALEDAFRSARLAVAVSVLAPLPRTQLPIVAMPDAFVVCVPPVTLPLPAVMANVTVTPASGLPLPLTTSTDGAGEIGLPARTGQVVGEFGEIAGSERLFEERRDVGDHARRHRDAADRHAGGRVVEGGRGVELHRLVHRRRRRVMEERVRGS